MNLTIREKWLLAILVLFIWAWFLAGCGSKNEEHASIVIISQPEVTIPYLKNLYAQDNERYFQNRLPSDPSIGMTEKLFMASTMCEDGSCTLEFNPKYVAAFRVADFTMLHEMCHIKTWGQEINPATGKEFIHGKIWRTCMLQLDAAGAFREIIIDNYNEGM